MKHQHSWRCTGCGETTMIDQPRQPNGQFGEVQRAEADGVDLIGCPAPHGLQGSFLYPPIVHNAAEAIAFWETCEIPDEVCTTAMRWYRGMWDKTTEHGADDVWAVAHGVFWDDKQNRPEPTDPVERAAWAAEKEQFGEQFRAELRETLAARPKIPDVRDVRQMVKAIGMIGSALTLESDAPAEAQAIRDHQLETTQGLMSVRDMNMNLGLFAFGTQLRDPYQHDRDEHEVADEVAAAVAGVAVEVAGLISQQTEELRAEFGVVNDNLYKTAQVTIATSR